MIQFEGNRIAIDFKRHLGMVLFSVLGLGMQVKLSAKNVPRTIFYWKGMPVAIILNYRHPRYIFLSKERK